MGISTDNFALYIATVSAVLAFAGYLLSAISQGRWPRLERWARGAYYCCAGSLAFTSIYLMQQILSGRRYDIAYIHSYSGPNDALIYRISSFWAGQEGSLLLWGLLIAAIGVALVRRQDVWLVCFWASVQAFVCLLLLVSDPFRPLASFQPGMVGMGMNPLLKNPWMAIHPPVVFLGYAGLVVPAAFAVRALLSRDAQNCLRACLAWTVFGWLTLTAGLVLGMVWSYEVLGWGGYWGWDPVENASLVPWLLGTALLHGLLFQRHTGRMARWNLVLALATFLSVLYATFLTRSGVLADVSVHSFTDLGAYRYLLGFLCFYTVLSTGLLAVRVWSVPAAGRAEASETAVGPRGALVAFGIIGLVLFALVVLVGTSYPLISNTVIKPEFYTKMSVPIAALVLVLIAAVPIAAWASSGSLRLHRVTRGATVAHVGVVLMVAGIALSSTGPSQKVIVTEGGSPEKAFGWAVSYVGREQGGPNELIVRLSLQRDGRRLDVPLSMEVTERGAVKRPFIKSSVAGDLYISPGDLSGTTIMPTASMTEEGLVSVPAEIPGSKATITLLGMQVEQDLARVQYNSPQGMPVVFDVAKGAPADVDGYHFEFRRLMAQGSHDMSAMVVGVDLNVTGNGVKEQVEVEVSKKPLIWMLWLGMALVVVGGTMAVAKRRADARKEPLPE